MPSEPAFLSAKLDKLADPENKKGRAPVALAKLIETATGYRMSTPQLAALFNARVAVAQLGFGYAWPQNVALKVLRENLEAFLKEAGLKPPRFRVAGAHPFIGGRWSIRM